MRNQLFDIKNLIDNTLTTLIETEAPTHTTLNNIILPQFSATEKTKYINELKHSKIPVWFVYPRKVEAQAQIVLSNSKQMFKPMAFGNIKEEIDVSGVPAFVYTYEATKTFNMHVLGMTEEIMEILLQLVNYIFLSGLNTLLAASNDILEFQRLECGDVQPVTEVDIGYKIPQIFSRDFFVTYLCEETVRVSQTAETATSVLVMDETVNLYDPDTEI